MSAALGAAWQAHRTPATGRTRTFGLLTVLTVLVALLGPIALFPAPGAAAHPAHAPAAGSPAHSVPAAPDSDDVRIRLASITPGVASPGTPITVRGTLRNLGDVPVPHPTLTIRRASVGLDTRSAVKAWADGSGRIEANDVIATKELQRAVPARGAVRFRVVIRGDAIQTGYRFTSLGVTVEVTTGTRSMGTVRTFLPWDSTSPDSHHPIRIGWVVPLILPGDPDLFGPSSPERTAAWTRAIGIGSRVDRLIRATAQAPVTWAVDPTLVEPPAAGEEFPSESPSPTTTPTTPATPTPTETSPTPPTTEPTSPSTSDDTATEDPSGTVGTGDLDGTDDTETTSPGTPPTTASPTEPAPGTTAPAPDEVQRMAAGLAARLRTEAGGHPLWTLPYGDPDLTALLRIDPGGAALRAALRLTTPDALGGLVRADVAWPIEGSLGKRQVNALRRAWKGARGDHHRLSAAVVPATALDGKGGYTGSATRRSAQGLPLLAYDERLSGLFAHTANRANGAVPVQQFLAETLAIYQERPATSRSLLVVAPRGFNGDPAVLSRLFAGVEEAPWLTPTSTDALLNQAKKAPKAHDRNLSLAPDSGAPGDLTTYPSARRAVLTPRRLSRIERLRSTTAGVASVLAQGDNYRAIWTQAADQLVSGRWRDSRGAWRELAGRIVDANAGVSSGISVVPSTFNFFADQGSLQLTVVNDLDVAVQEVHLTLSPRNPRLRILEQPGPLRIGPHSRTTVKVRVDGISAGLVPVDATLSAPDGTSLGQMTSVTVRVQPTSTWIYWVLGIVGGLILVLGLYRALRRGAGPRIDPGSAQETPEP